MFALLKGAHAGLRWLLLAGVILLIIQAARGMSSNAPYAGQQSRLSLLTMIVADLQLTIGLLLYTTFSPLTTQAILPNMGVAMKDRVLRFWAVEHITAMILCIAMIHATRIFVKRADNDALKQKRSLYGFAFALMFLWAGMPWPWKPYGRPLIGDAPAPSASVVPSAAPSGR